MEVSFFQNGFALQGSFQQMHEKNTEAATASPAIKGREMADMQAKFMERIAQVQKSSKTDAESAQFDGHREQEDLLDLSRKVQEKLKENGVKVQLNFDRKFDRMLILVKDPVTDEVVRQIPPEDMLKIAETIKQIKPDLGLQGLEIDVKF